MSAWHINYVDEEAMVLLGTDEKRLLIALGLRLRYEFVGQVVLDAEALNHDQALHLSPAALSGTAAEWCNLVSNDISRSNYWKSHARSVDPRSALNDLRAAITGVRPEIGTSLIILTAAVLVLKPVEASKKA